MIELKNLTIGKNVYWVDQSRDEVRNGFIDEIRVTKESINCIMKNQTYKNESLYLTFADAEICLVDKLIQKVKQNILSEAVELKNLRCRKSDALILKIGKII